MGLSEQDKAILDDRGYIATTGDVDRKKLGKEVNGILMKTHQILKPYPDAAAEKGALVGSLVLQVLEETGDDLEGLIAHLTTTSAQGVCQKLLPNGYILGSSRVSKPFDFTLPDGTEITKNVSVAVRWVSKNPAVVKSMILQPLKKRQHTRGQRDASFLALISQRQKSLDGFIRNELLPDMHNEYGRGLTVVPELDESGDEEETG